MYGDLLFKKIDFRQNITTPRITELPLQPTQMYHTSLTRAVANKWWTWLDRLCVTDLGLVLVSSCGYTFVASRLSCFVWNLFFWKIGGNYQCFLTHIHPLLAPGQKSILLWLNLTHFAFFSPFFFFCSFLKLWQRPWMKLSQLIMMVKTTLLPRLLT